MGRIKDEGDCVSRHISAHDGATRIRFATGAGAVAVASPKGKQPLAEGSFNRRVKTNCPKKVDVCKFKVECLK